MLIRKLTSRPALSRNDRSSNRKFQTHTKNYQLHITFNVSIIWWYNLMLHLKHVLLIVTNEKPKTEKETHHHTIRIQYDDMTLLKTTSTIKLSELILPFLIFLSLSFSFCLTMPIILQSWSSSKNKIGGPPKAEI